MSTSDAPVDFDELKTFLDTHPHAFVRALIGAEKTGKLVLKGTPFGDVDLDVVGLTRVDGKVIEVPLNRSTGLGQK